MRKLSAFNFITINGCFKGPNGDTSWHVHGEEGAKYSEQQLEAGNILLFGRKTYEMMSAFWPTRMAHDTFPKVAEGMNAAEKLVVSNTLEKAGWTNTRILSGDWIGELKQIKNTKGKDITILGSGSIIAQLADERLIDEYQFLIDPVAIGTGTPVLADIKEPLRLSLIESRVFKKSGEILARYKCV